MTQTDHRRQLVRLLQLAYSGEKAAAFAYSGHWRSVKNQAQKDRIRKIEEEEWEHRATVGRILETMGEKPALWREILMGLVGRSASFGCFVSGWFLPMYFAGKLEHANVNEYDTAAMHAGHLGLDEFLPELRAMTRTEQEHEIFFSEMVAGHRFLPVVRAIAGWDPEPVLLAAGKTGPGL